MTQLGMGVAALNHDSKFVQAYDKGVKKTEYWTYALEDSLDLIAKLPALAARIYRNVHKPQLELAPLDKTKDLVGMVCFLRAMTSSNANKQGTMPTCLDMVTMMVWSNTSDYTYLFMGITKVRLRSICIFRI